MFDRVLETLPLYDILNEFQKGHSHMAVVIRHSKTVEQPNGNTADSKHLLPTLECLYKFSYRKSLHLHLLNPLNYMSVCFSYFCGSNRSLSLLTEPVKEVKVDIDGEKPLHEKIVKSKRSLQTLKSFPNSGSNNSYRGGSRSKKWAKEIYSDILQIDGESLPKLPDEEEAVGIITMEDVIEELLQV